jgi:hypothetical protein
MACAAVVLALRAIFGWSQSAVNVSNLAGLKHWVESEIRPIAISGLLLTGSVIVAGGLSALVITTDGAVNSSLSLQSAGVGDQTKITAKVQIQGLSPESRVLTTVIGTAPDGKETTMFRNVSTVDSSKKLTVSGNIPYLRSEEIRLEVAIPGRSKPIVERLVLQ